MEILINDIFFNDSDLAIIHGLTESTSCDCENIFLGIRFDKFTKALEMHGQIGKEIIELIDRKFIDYQDFVNSVDRNPFTESKAVGCPSIRVNLIKEAGFQVKCEVENDIYLNSTEIYKRMVTQAKNEIDFEINNKCYEELYEHFYEKVDILIDCFKYEEARIILLEAIEYFPDKQGFKINLGLCQRELSEHSAALKTFNDILKSDNECYLAYINKAILFRKLRKFNLSIKYLKIAGNIDKVDTQSIRELAITYGEMGKTKKALQYAHVLLDAEPDEEESHLILGFVYERMGKYKKAINTFNHILNEMNPFDHWALINRSKILFEKFDETDKALNDLKMAQNLGNPYAKELIEEIRNDLL